MSQPYRAPTARDVRAHDLLSPVALILRSADRPLTIPDVLAEMRRARADARYYDVQHALYVLRRRGLVHGRKTWAWGSSPNAKRPVTIRRLEDAA